MNLLNFDSQDQRRKVIQCHFSFKLYGMSRSKAAFCVQAVSEAQECWPKPVMSQLLLKCERICIPTFSPYFRPKAESVSTLADYLLPTPKPDTVAEDTWTHIKLPQPLKAHCLCRSSRENKWGRSPSFPCFSHTEEQHGNSLPTYSHQFLVSALQ